MDESPRAHFEAGCAREVLLYQWDPAAERAVFYPRVGEGLEWRESTGRGTVYSTTTIRLRGEQPRGVALIDLDEGFRMMSRVRAEVVEIGMRVLVDFEEGVPVFDPVP